MILPAQLKAARALLGWSQDRLAQASGVGASTIKRMETREGSIGGHADNVWKIEAALEDAGISFLDESDVDGVGVRLKKWPPRD